MLHDNENDQLAVTNPRAVIGGNKPPEPTAESNDKPIAHEDKRIAELVANADEWAAKHPSITDEDVADAAANWLKQLTDHIKEFEDKFKAEKAPHEAKLVEVRGKYRPWLEKLEICLKSIRPRHRAWIKFDDDRKKAAAATATRAAAEEQRRAEQLAEQAKTGGPNAVTREIVAREAAQEAARLAEAARAMPTRAQVRPSLGGPTLSLRTVWRARIIEDDVLYMHLRNDRDVMELLQRKADAAARQGTRNPNLPGCEIYSTQE